MTFEEFRQEQERFSPIDTQAKLEDAKRRYDHYILMLEDSNFLEPIEGELVQEFAVEAYGSWLISIFKPTELSTGEVRILVQPSFTPEYQITIVDQTVRVERLSENLWVNLYDGKQAKGVEKSAEIYHKRVPDLDVLTNEIGDMVKQARKPRAQTLVLDGTQYFFFVKVQDHVRMAKKHSFTDDSRSGKLIIQIHDTMDQITES